MIVLRTSNVTMLIDDVMQSRTTTQANLNELKHGWTVARRNLYRPRARPRMTHLSPDARMPATCPRLTCVPGAGPGAA